MRTDNGNFLRQLYGATFLTDEARCNFARPTCWKHARRAETPLMSSMPLGAVEPYTMMGLQPTGATCNLGSHHTITNRIDSRQVETDSNSVPIRLAVELQSTVASLEQERLNPVSFAIGNSWTDTLRADKQHYLEYTARSMT